MGSGSKKKKRRDKNSNREEKKGMERGKRGRREERRGEESRGGEKRRKGEGETKKSRIHSEKFSSRVVSMEVIVLSMANGTSSLRLREVVKRMFSGLPLLSQMMGMRSQLLITTS